MLNAHMNAEELSQLARFSLAFMLFKQGRISSGTASRWLAIPRTVFLLKATEVGAELLEDSQDDLMRETALL
jgi:hypothetical protein